MFVVWGKHDWIIWQSKRSIFILADWFFRKSTAGKCEAWSTKWITGCPWRNMVSTWTLLLSTNLSATIFNLNRRDFEAAKLHIRQSPDSFWIEYLVLESSLSPVVIFRNFFMSSTLGCPNTRWILLHSSCILHRSRFIYTPRRSFTKTILAFFLGVL